MTEFAIVDDGRIVEIRDLDQKPELAGKPYRRILPVITDDPPFDPATQTRTGPVITIEKDRVTRVWTVADRTAEDIAAERAERLDGEVDALGIAFRVLFNHENRIRALEGKAAITAATFRDAIKALG